MNWNPSFKFIICCRIVNSTGTLTIATTIEANKVLENKEINVRGFINGEEIAWNTIRHNTIRNYIIWN